VLVRNPQASSEGVRHQNHLHCTVWQHSVLSASQVLGELTAADRLFCGSMLYPRPWFLALPGTRDPSAASYGAGYCCRQLHSTWCWFVLPPTHWFLLTSCHMAQMSSRECHMLYSAHTPCVTCLVFGVCRSLCIAPILLQMKDFALRGYKSATSLAFHKAPNSALGRVMGIVYR
jgi:hypothetical protein